MSSPLQRAIEAERGHTEDSIRRLLAARHATDLFVAGCKNGPTQKIGARLRILDAWVLASTWSPATCLGYEIKISRGDWLRDEKWAEYLPLCHLFSIVAPKGLIQPEELPKGVGLLEAIGKGTGARLVTRRKAVRRAIEWPIDLMIYVLMSRVRVRQEAPTAADERAARGEFWRARFETEDALRTLGRQNRTAFAKALEQACSERDAARRAVERLEGVRAALVRLGLDPDRQDQWSIQNRIEHAAAARRLEHLEQQASELAASLKRVRETLAPKPAETAAEVVA